MRFRDVIAADLEARRRRDPAYSLRRFARLLGVHHSTVSRLLRRRRPVTPRTVHALGTRLGISDAEIANLSAAEDAAAIVHAIERPAFRPDSRWLASVASMPVDRVNVVLQRLLRIGALRMLARDRWEVMSGVTE
jgi:plasmid maintenance system antidote protein VapI